MTAAPRRLGANAVMRMGDTQPHLGQQLGSAEPARDLAQRFGDDPRRDVPGLMPAGPVGHRPDPEIGPVDVIVLVAGPHRADMGRGAGAKPAGARHPGGGYPGGGRLSAHRQGSRLSRAKSSWPSAGDDKLPASSMPA